jgi:hypothetical protein
MSHKDNVARGIKLYQDGKGIFARTPEQITEDARKGGNVQGAKNRDNGHWARVSQLSDRVAAAKKAGKIAVETGQVYEIQNHEASVRGGKTQGNNAKESGQWDVVRPYGLHIRHHVYNLRNADSKFCFFCDTKDGQVQADILAKRAS